MNLRELTNIELLEKTLEAATREREATTVLLHHLNEVERRRLYANSGYASLFEYCVRVLKMPNAQAGRRIASARALREFPEIEGKLNSGALSVTTLSQAQILFKKVAFKREEKKEILQKIEGKTSRNVEKLLVHYAPEEAKKDKARAINPTLTELRITVNDEVMQNIERLKELWSHEIPNASLSDLLQKMAYYCREKLDPEKKRLSTSSTDAYTGCSTGAPTTGSTSPAPDAHSVKKTRYIPAQIKREIYQRDKSCTYVSSSTGQRCNSKYFLEIHHKEPFAKGGANSKENLSLLCRTHNNLLACQEYGNEKIQHYQKREAS